MILPYDQPLTGEGHDELRQSGVASFDWMPGSARRLLDKGALVVPRLAIHACPPRHGEPTAHDMDPGREVGITRLRVA